jgi:very-short-patch-repair endonuclease
LYTNDTIHVDLGEVPGRAVGAELAGVKTVSFKRSNPKTMHRAGELRREMTPAERRLWAYLRGNRLNGVGFRRQHAIGNFIVDFCAPRQKLVIELDGGQHLDQEEYDAERTAFLEGQGYRVLRFWNDAVMNDLQGVIRAIQIALEDR